MADFHNNKPKRKKVCFMCIGKDVNYKNVEIISKYINDSGDISIYTI